MELVLDHITTGYPGHHLLQEVTTTCSSGSLVALLGRNAAGKSTLLRHLAGTLPLPKGSVLLDGQDLAGLSPRVRAQLVSVVSTKRIRNPLMTAYELVALGRSPHTDWIGALRSSDKDCIHEALRLTGMAGHEAHTLATMSDGELQRTMIARAIAQDTPVVLLDEPTAFLDLPNRYEIGLLLRNIAHTQGKLILFSTHELDIAFQLCDSIMLLAPPHLHHLPTDEMRTAGLVEQLFTGPNVRFDPATATVHLTLPEKESGA